MSDTEPTVISTVRSVWPGETITLYASENPEKDAQEAARRTGKGVYVNTSLFAIDNRGVTVHKIDDKGTVYAAVQGSVAD